MSADSTFEPATILAELEEKAAASTPSNGPLPDHLLISKVVLQSPLFQPRGIFERHVEELRRAIRVSGPLEPLTVIWVGGDAVLIDGHHRHEAYRRERTTKPIPVRAFEGSLREAVLESGQANSKAKLSMTSTERQDYAWRLVLLGSYSKRQTRLAAGISDGQVATMRRVAKALGDEAAECSSWTMARIRAQGREFTPMTEEEQEEALKAQANAWADHLARTFGTRLAMNIEITAMAFEVYFGRQLPELVRELNSFSDFGIEDAEEGEDEDF